MKKKKTGSIHKVEWQMWVFLLFIILFVFVIVYLKNPISKFNNKDNSDISNSSVKDSGSALMPSEPLDYKNLGLMEAKTFFDENKADGNFVIIDVSSDYRVGHILGADNYPISDGTFYKIIEGLDKTKTYFVYSRVGPESETAAKKMIENGFKNVYRLKDNYGAWVVAGYPISYD